MKYLEAKNELRLTLLAKNFCFWEEMKLGNLLYFTSNGTFKRKYYSTLKQFKNLED